MAKRLKIGLIQANVAAQIEENLDGAGNYINQAAEEGAEIICLQELFATKYLAQKEDKKLFEQAEKIPGKITNFLFTHSRLSSSITFCLLKDSKLIRFVKFFS